MLTESTTHFRTEIARLLTMIVRSLAIGLIWLVCVAFFGFAYYLGGRRQPNSIEVIEFTSAFAMGSAVAAATVFLLTGQRRWALALMRPILIVLALAISGSYVLIWVIPSVSQSFLKMNPRDFLIWRQIFLTNAISVAAMVVPTGLVLGVLCGAVASALLLLARRGPRLITWLLVGLLVGFVPGQKHIDAFASVTSFVVDTRLRMANRLERSWHWTHELLAAMGGTAGALVGAAIAIGAAQTHQREPGAKNR